MIKELVETIESRLDKTRVMDLYSQEESDDPIVSHIFICMNSFWIMTEADLDKQLGFGWCEPIRGSGELGYFSLKELEDINQEYGVNIINIEDGSTLSQVKKRIS